jgi:hypothetical protein
MVVDGLVEIEDFAVGVFQRIVEVLFGGGGERLVLRRRRTARDHQCEDDHELRYCRADGGKVHRSVSNQARFSSMREINAGNPLNRQAPAWSHQAVGWSLVDATAAA